MIIAPMMMLSHVETMMSLSIRISRANPVPLGLLQYLHSRVRGLECFTEETGGFIRNTNGFGIKYFADLAAILGL
jgi:hypothetical protein